MTFSFKPKLIALVTDFGVNGPYIGQITTILYSAINNIRVVNLIADLPPFRPDLAAYLLPQLILDIPNEIFYLCVVDPGVGSNRLALVMKADGNWFLGPDNGLLSIIARRAKSCTGWHITWKPDRVSNSFHGRDIFTPATIALINGKRNLLGPAINLHNMIGCDWPNDLYKIIYKDHYGNLCTGIRANIIPHTSHIKVGTQNLRFARTFSEVSQGTAFWYENAFGLLELAVNCDSASQVLKLMPGDGITLEI